MSVTININGLSLVHKGSNGTAIATMPDVCKTPSPGGPVPIPYPNIAMSKDLAKGTTTVKVDGGNMAANQGSELMLSTGDEAGTAGGVVSSTFIKEATWITYSFDVTLEGKGACRLTDKMFMNHMNTACMAGFIQQWLQEQLGKKNKNKNECDKLFKKIVDQAFNNPKGDVRGLDGKDGRFEQNTQGGGLGPKGAPNAPRTHGPVEGYPEGANDWETHDSEIKRQQKSLKKDLDKFNDKCDPGSKLEKKVLDEVKEIADRKAPTPEEWEGPNWEPEGEFQTAPLLSPSTVDAIATVAVVGGCLLVAAGLLGSIFSGGTSLALSAAGVAIIAGATTASGPSPGGNVPSA